MSATIVYSGGSDTMGGLELGFWLLYGVSTLVGYVFILRKAGYSGWLVLLGLIPLVNVVAFFVFAFSEWPVIKELRATRRAYDLYRQNRNRQQVGPY